MSIRRLISIFCTILLFSTQTSLQEMLHLFFEGESLAHKYCLEHDRVEHTNSSHESNAKNNPTGASADITTIEVADFHVEESTDHNLCIQFQTRCQTHETELVYNLRSGVPLVEDRIFHLFEKSLQNSVSIYLFSPSCSPPLINLIS